MGNVNRACDWPHCNCKTDAGEPCKHDDPDFHIRKAEDVAKPDEPVKRQIGTIDITPTWRGVLPILIEGLTNGNARGVQIATEELRKMAEAADMWNAHCKKDAD